MNNRTIFFSENKKIDHTVEFRKEMVASRRNRTADHRSFKVNCFNTIFFSENKKIDHTVEFRKEMVARDGIEPPTQGFSVPCSTN